MSTVVDNLDDAPPARPSADLDSLAVTVWSDFLCPYCWISRPRVSWIRDLGASVTWQPYELHPEIPPAGIPATAFGRLGASRRDDLTALAAEEGVALRFPDRIPNTRRAHEAVEWARDLSAEAALAMHEAIFVAYWEQELDIGAIPVVVTLAQEQNLPAAMLEKALETGDFSRNVDEARAGALLQGSTGAPSFLLQRNDAVFLVPGIQPRELFTRVVARLGT